MKKEYSSALFFILLVASSQAQGLLNKLKDKATQEVNKLERGSTSSPAQAPQASKNKLSANVSHTVVVSLETDEVFDYSENCIDLGTSISQVSFIVTKRSGNTTQCYAYRNGSRTAVACPTFAQNNACQTSLQCSYSLLRELQLNDDEIKKYVVNQTESHAMQQPTVTDQQTKMMAAYMTPQQLDDMKKKLADAQKQSANQTYSTITSSAINFNGKTFGPYKQVSKFYLTPDGKNFYAIVGESKDGSAYVLQTKMIASASTTELPLANNSTAISCLASPDNTEFGYVNYEMTSQKYVVITSSGKRYEMPTGGAPGQAWYSASGNHVIYLWQNQLFLDQQSIKTFSANEYVKPCDLYVTSDGKGVSVIQNNTITFADGDFYEYPLKISIVTDGGRIYYRWLALENQKVVVYQKPY